MVRRMSKDREKFCNICGEGVLVYTIQDNAPLCNKCVPVKEVKKIMNEKQMVEKILNKNNGTKRRGIIEDNKSKTDTQTSRTV